MKKFKAVHNDPEVDPRIMLVHIQIVNEALRAADNLANDPQARGKYIALAKLYSSDVLKYFVEFEELPVDKQD